MICVIHLWCLAQHPIEEKFTYGFHNNEEVPMPYRLFIPDNYNSSISYPIVLSLHGAGAKGTDNEMQIKEVCARYWAYSAFQSKYATFVVAPQCPEFKNWDNINAIRSVIALLDSIAFNYNIDINRIYVTGISMGGIGTWWSLAVAPDKFAAAMPMCGTGRPEFIQMYSHVPVWNSHGNSDPIVDVTWSRRMMSKYHKLGLPVVFTECQMNTCNKLGKQEKWSFIENNVDIIYSEYNNGGHTATNNFADTIAPYWLFSKQRRIKDAITFIDSNKYESINGEYNIKLKTKYPNAEMEILYSNDLGISWNSVYSDTITLNLASVNTTLIPDCPFTILKAQMQVSSTLVNATDYTLYKRIDNTGSNGKPIIRIYPAEDINTIKKDSVMFQVLAGDAELNSLNLNILYKNENLSEYSIIKSKTVLTSDSFQECFINFKNLPKGDYSRLRFDLSDDFYTVSDSTHIFKNPLGTEPLAINNKRQTEIRSYINANSLIINFKINCPTEFQCKIHSIAGATLYNNSFSNTKQLQIDISTFETGLFFLQIIYDEQSYTQKIMIIQ